MLALEDDFEQPQEDFFSRMTVVGAFLELSPAFTPYSNSKEMEPINTNLKKHFRR
jgi:hypothetical protein